MAVFKDPTKKLEAYNQLINDFVSKLEKAIDANTLDITYKSFLKENDRLKKELARTTVKARYTAANLCSEALKKYKEKLSLFTGK